jgi:hypothetical protein
MEDPSDLSVIDDLRFRTGIDIVPLLVAPSEREAAIERHYRKPLNEALDLAEQDEDAEVSLAGEISGALAVGMADAIDAAEAFLLEEVPNEEAPGRLKVQPRDLLNALSELLLEKGILTLEEISERVHQVQSRHHSEE